MPKEDEGRSRRGFVTDLGLAALLAPLGLPIADAGPGSVAQDLGGSDSGQWDLSWIKRLKAATDRAVFDWATLGDPVDPIVLEIAARYLDNCVAVYGDSGFRPGIVLNIRTTATAAGLADGLWERFELGADTGVVDPDTKQSARRNPFWRHASYAPAGMPDLADLMQRGCIVLVCDFALGHLARRVATRIGREPESIHQELRAGCIAGAYVVPSGIFGLARSQNAGCAFVRM